MTSLAHDTTNDNRFADAIKRAQKLGTDSVKSALSKPNLAIELVRGIVDEVFDTQEKIDAQFDAYVAARTKEVSKHALAQGATEDNENSIKANRSKHKQIAELAKLPSIDAVELLDAVMDHRKVLLDGGAKVKPTYDCFVDVARAQLKQPLEQLDGDTLDKIIAKAEPKEKDLLQKLGEAYKRTYKLAESMADDMIDCTHIEAAYQALADAITALDGEVPSMTKADKKDDEMVGFLMAKGYTKAQARELVKGK